VLHAGTALQIGGDDDGRVVTAGGRVLSVVGTGESLDDARRTAYAATDRIRIRGAHRRSDIALGSTTEAPITAG
jgi:phosphoribosylamine--glycine ligase